MRMLKVDDYRRIRRAHRDGMSIREIARVLHHSRHKIRKVLQNATPEPYTLQAPRLKRKLTEPFQYLMDAILQEDDGAPRKQRHTAKRIFDRLQAEHDYTGGYDTVRRYVNALKGNHRETFMPLAHEAGQRAESEAGFNKDAVIIELGVKYTKYTVRASYDINTSSLKAISNGRGGFEVSFTYIPAKLKPNPVPNCPRI